MYLYPEDGKEETMYMTEKELKDIVAYQAKQIMQLESVITYLRQELGDWKEKEAKKEEQDG